MRPYIALPFALVLIAGCDNSLSPRDVVGGHKLVTIHGQAPPQIVVDAPTCRISVIDATLDLRPDNRFELELEEVTACPNPTEPGGVSELILGTYTVSGGAVILRTGDPPFDIYTTIRDGRLMVPLGRYGEMEFIL